MYCVVEFLNLFIYICTNFWTLFWNWNKSVFFTAFFFKQESKHMCERPQMTHRTRWAHTQFTVDVDRLQSRITSLSDCVAYVVVSRISSLGFENLNAFEFSLKMNANESPYARSSNPRNVLIFLELYVWYKKCVVAKLKVLLKLLSNTKYDLAIKKCNNIEIVFSSAPLKKMDIEKNTVKIYEYMNFGVNE